MQRAARCAPDEAASIINIVRRIGLECIKRVSPVTGEFDVVTTTVRLSNLYTIQAPGPQVEQLPTRRPKAMGVVKFGLPVALPRRAEFTEQTVNDSFIQSKAYLGSGHESDHYAR